MGIQSAPEAGGNVTVGVTVGVEVSIGVGTGVSVAGGGSVAVGSGAGAVTSAESVEATKASISSSERVGATFDGRDGVAHEVKNVTNPSAAATTRSCLTHTV